MGEWVCVGVWVWVSVCLRVVCLQTMQFLLLQVDTIDELRTQAARVLGGCVAIWMVIAAVCARCRLMPNL